MLYPQLDIKDKELPTDFLLYFDENGVEKDDCPYDFGSFECKSWCARLREIAYMFMTQEQIDRHNAWRRHVKKKSLAEAGIVD